MNRGIRVLVSVLLGVVLAAAIAYVQTRGGPQNAPSGVAGAKVGGHFAGLVDENGKALGQEDFAGKYQLVFFGFTHCPAICPTELTRISYVLKNLDAPEREQVAALFITVDPERDTPAHLKEYAALFHPDIRALSGPADELARVRRDWKVYAAKVETGDTTEYTMDHSAYLYLRGPDGLLIDIFDAHEGSKPVLDAVKAALKR